MANHVPLFTSNGHGRGISVSSIETIRAPARAGSPNPTHDLRASGTPSLDVSHPQAGQEEVPLFILDDAEDGGDEHIISIVAIRDTHASTVATRHQPTSSPAAATHVPDDPLHLPLVLNAETTDMSASSVGHLASGTTMNALASPVLSLEIESLDDEPCPVLWDDDRQHHLWRGEVYLRITDNKPEVPKFPTLAGTLIECRSVGARPTRRGPFRAMFTPNARGAIRITKTWASISLGGSEMEWSLGFEIPFPIDRLFHAEVLMCEIDAWVIVGLSNTPGGVARYKGGAAFNITHLQRARAMASRSTSE